MQKRVLIFLIIAILNQSQLLSQSSHVKNSFNPKLFLSSLPPFFLKNVFLLKNYIRSDKFREIRNNYGDLAAVDSIFEKAMQITYENTGFSLLISTLATFDHYSLNINIPFINLAIPLSNETKAHFENRLQNMPSHFLPDSPSYSFGDKDKLQHIFGSAFLVYIFESKIPAKNYSIFVEKVEDRYIKDGSYDERDLFLNKIGQEFGFKLLKNQKIKPSDVIKQFYKFYENNSNN